MNINEMTALLIDILSSNNIIANPRLEAEKLIENELKVNKAYLLSHNKDFIGLNIVKKIKRLAKKRADNYPLAYITGHKEFYGLDFFVNKDVLVPRPETELMVDLALARLRTDNNVDILDIGTGSGCIAVSVAKNAPDKKGVHFFACDISEKALASARKNARKHLAAKKISFFKSDLLENAISYLSPGKGLVILANLPYLSRQQINSSPSIQHEPKVALEAKDDGLYLYNKLFTQINNSLEKTRVNIYCEFDHTQSEKILKLANEILPRYKKKIIKDLGRYDRIIEIYKGV